MRVQDHASPADGAARVRIRREVLDDIAAHARDESPNECCGLLLGTPVLVETSRRARNALASPSRYRIQPEDHFAAIRAARARGVDVVGAYHSHPASPPVPSAADVEEAIAAPFLYLIAGANERGERAIQAWRLSGGNFVAVGLVTLQ